MNPILTSAFCGFKVKIASVARASNSIVKRYAFVFVPRRAELTPSFIMIKAPGRLATRPSSRMTLLRPEYVSASFCWHPSMAEYGRQTDREPNAYASTGNTETNAYCGNQTGFCNANGSIPGSQKRSPRVAGDGICDDRLPALGCDASGIDDCG